MKITSIKIRNVLGLAKLDLAPGAVNIISGKNGAGKTSFLNSIRAGFRGGHDPGLLRHGAKEGTIEFGIEDGTQIVRRITAERTTVDVAMPIGGRIGKPQAFLDSIVDDFGVDPMAIVESPANKRADLLADVMPLEVTPQEIHTAAGRGALDDGIGHPLDRIERARKTLYDERTGVNRAKKEKAATANQLRESLPATAAEVVPDPSAIIAERVAVVREKSAHLDGAREEKEREVAAARKTAEEALAKINADLNQAIVAAHRKFTGATDALAVEYDPRLAEFDQKIGKAEEALKAFAGQKKAREIAEEMEREVESLGSQAEALSNGIDGLDGLKRALLERLPIKGLEIRAGDVFVDGVPFDHVNLAKQVEVAVQVAKLRAGKLGLIVVDRIESLDSETLEIFKAAAVEAGLQVFTSKVSDGPLAVESK